MHPTQKKKRAARPTLDLPAPLTQPVYNCRAFHKQGGYETGSAPTSIGFSDSRPSIAFVDSFVDVSEAACTPGNDYVRIGDTCNDSTIRESRCCSADNNDLGSGEPLFAATATASKTSMVAAPATLEANIITQRLTEPSTVKEASAQ